MGWSLTALIKNKIDDFAAYRDSEMYPVMRSSPFGSFLARRRRNTRIKFALAATALLGAAYVGVTHMETGRPIPKVIGGIGHVASSLVMAALK